MGGHAILFEYLRTCQRLSAAKRADVSVMSPLLPNLDFMHCVVPQCLKSAHVVCPFIAPFSQVVKRSELSVLVGFPLYQLAYVKH